MVARNIGQLPPPPHPHPPTWIPPSFACKEAICGRQRERTPAKKFGCSRRREKKKKTPLASFTSLSSVHPSDLLKPCLTETTLQVFRLPGDHGVAEETKNRRDVECMFGTAPASQEDIKDDGFAAIWPLHFPPPPPPSPPSRPDRSCRTALQSSLKRKTRQHFFFFLNLLDVKFQCNTSPPPHLFSFPL